MSAEPLNETVTRARALHEAGDANGAARLLIRALAQAPGTADAWLLLARIEHGRGRRPAEATALREALAAGADPDWWGRLGAVLADGGDWRGAADAVVRLIGHRPADRRALEGLARCRLALADAVGAQRAADALRMHFPGSAFTHLYQGHVNKALGHMAAAIDHYRRALAVEPERAEALYALADLDPTALSTTEQHTARTRPR